MERNYMQKIGNSKTKVYVIAAIAILVVIILAVKFNPFSSQASTGSNSGPKVAIKDAKATMVLNKEFKFPLKNEKNETMGEIKYVIENAELRDEIVVKGKRASAVDGRTFLILNLKIVNDTNQKISINTSDYVRLFVNNNDKEALEPNIHNDPVVIGAISAKPTRVGFAINEADQNFKIKVGEIKGEKTTVDLKF